VNVFVVAPESLPTLIDSSLGEAKEEAMRSNQSSQPIICTLTLFFNISAEGKGYIRTPFFPIVIWGRWVWVIPIIYPSYTHPGLG
jgi:hypothetical protein